MKYVDNEYIEKFINASRDTEPVQEMDKIWNSLKSNKPLEIKETKNDNNKIIQITGIPKDYPIFPQKNYGKPDKAEINILIRSFFSQLNMGTVSPVSSIKLNYINWIRRKFTANGLYRTIQAKGAWIELSYSRSLVDYISDDIYVERDEQELSPSEEGILKVQFKLENVGNGDAYNVRYQILIGENVTYFGHRKGITKVSEKKEKEGSLLTFDLNAPINAGELIGGIIYLKYNKVVDQEHLETDDIKQLPIELNVAKESSVIMDLTDKKGQNEVTQHLRKTLVFKYTNYAFTHVNMDLIVSGRRKNPTVTIKPKIQYNGKNNENNVEIYIVKKDVTKYSNTTQNVDNINVNNITNYITKVLYKKDKVTEYVNDEPNEKEISNENHHVLYYLYAYTNEGTISRSLIYKQENIGLSATEWVLIILSIIIYITSFVIIYFSYRNYKLLGSGVELNKKVDETKLAKLLDE